MRAYNSKGNEGKGKGGEGEEGEGKGGEGKGGEGGLGKGRKRHPKRTLNMSQRKCITEALESGLTECRSFLFSLLSPCLLSWSQNFQILSTLNPSA